MAQVFKKWRTGLDNFWQSWIVDSALSPAGSRRSELFRSARVKLTGFYLIILIIFSLILTLSLRGLAGHAFDQAGAGDRGAVRRLFDDYYSVPLQPNGFNRFQTSQSATVHRDLNIDVAVVNIVVIAVGGVLSYWYAGRTLRPIEKAHETQARFAADASHELRTPLTALKVENEVFLHQKSSKPDEARELIKSNLEEVQRLESLAGNLLALSQYEQVSLKLQPTELSSIIATALEHAAKAAKARRVSFASNVASGAVVLGQADSLVQLAGILVDNAIKYGPARGKVYVDVIKGDGRYYLSVRDEGAGISEADLPYIFDRLYRGDKSRTSKTPGYGLGLSLAQEIARANRASITARNYPTGGAQFVVSLLPAKG